MSVSESLARYLEEAKIEDLRREWEARGYRVSREVPIGKFRADLVAKRNGETVVIEVKTSRSLAQERETVQQLARLAAESPNTSFHLVIANPPQEKSIEVENLSDVLSDYLFENVPNVIGELATHVRVESVDDVEIYDVQIQRGQTRVLGNGVILARLEYGSTDELRTDDGLVSYEAFPFEFDLLLDENLSLLAVNKLAVDTSSFEE